jgi:hypothetical protein
METATIYPEVKNALNIIVKIHSNDNGYMEKERLLTDPELPARAHILSKDKKNIGLLNITGPQPIKVTEINQFFEKKDNSEKIFSLGIKKEILSWALMRAKSDPSHNCWEQAVILWNTYHPDNNFEGEI